jgi:predicted phage terminase large subunit-like protein
LKETESEIGISLKFRPLFKLLDDKIYPDVDTVIITGGRYSLKSYTVSIFALIALVHYQWNILYTRFTNMSLIDSVKPEVSDKIEMLGLTGTVHDTTTHIEFNNCRISFKGIKTGSGIQTANLKSLSGFNLFINDEAEELPDYKTFKKVFYSMRSAKKRNLTILILNPTTKEHWIFKEFFEKKGLNGGDNCIKDNVMYIHSSYLDADQEQIPNNILADYNRLKTDDPKEYENIVMGGWITELEGQVFPESSLKRYREFPPDDVEYFTVGYVDPADEGTDSFACPIGRVYGNMNRVYIFDAIFDSTLGLSAYLPLTQDKVKIHKISHLAVETNSFGAWFAQHCRELMPTLEVFGLKSKKNKMARILSNSGLVKQFFYFPEQPNPDLQKFMKQLSKMLKTSKDHDDAADSLTGLAAYLEHYFQLFKNNE